MNSKLSSCPSSHLFPKDLWPDVLARLPVKTILKFRCVCREFRSIIDTPGFALKQLKSCETNRINTHLFVVERPFRSDIKDYILRKSDDFSKIIDLEFESDIMMFYHFEIYQGFVNGLVLMYLIPSGRRVKRKLGPTIVLWNPSIRKHIQIRSPVASTSDCLGVELCLGFDHLSNNHKIFVIFHPISFPNDSLTIHVYSYNDTNNNNTYWTQKTIEGFTFYVSREKLYFRGYIYMTGHEHSTPSIRPSYDTHLIVIDVANETIVPLVGLPKLNCPDFIIVRTLTIINESLALFDHGLYDRSIWVIDEYLYWTKKYELALYMDSYVFVRDTNLMLYEGEDEDRGIFSYEIETEDIIQVSKTGGLWNSYYVSTYEESLILHRALPVIAQEEP